MDDPWGSPWTTTDHTTLPQPPPRQTKSDLELPPAVFLSTPPADLTPIHGHPSWFDDDGFGDWASADTTQPRDGSGWGIWGADGSHNASAQLTPAYEPRQKNSSPKWPRSRSASPGQKIPGLPNGLASEQPSPDPWATEGSFSKIGPEPVSALPQIPDLPQLPPSQIGSWVEPTSKAALVQLQATSSDLELHSLTSSEPAPGTTPVVGEELPHVKPSLEPSATISSRSNSLASQTSEVDERNSTLLPQSPITSVEDNGMRLCAAERKASKVKELVEMYDGIALGKRVGTPEGILAPNHSVSQERLAGVVISVRGDTPQPLEIDDDSAALDFPPQIAEAAVVVEVSGQNPTQRSETPQLSQSHDPFLIDMAKINELVQDFESELFGPDEDVSDHVIEDTFSSISERKTWYRISRNEPLRKHNAGGDESYVRVTWLHSAVRSDTITIVRRWMEEDSIGGRTFRGVLTKGAGGNMFGWGSTASPVDLGTVFARKRSAELAKDASVHRPNRSIDTTMSMATTSALFNGRKISNASLSPHNDAGQQGLATFGWSTGTENVQQVQQVSPAAASGKPMFNPQSCLLQSSLEGIPPYPIPSSQTPSLPFGMPKSEQVTKLQTNDSEEDENEDENEDDWGDMVSPTAAETEKPTSIMGWNMSSNNQVEDIYAANGTANLANTEISVDDIQKSGHDSAESGLSTNRTVAHQLNASRANEALVFDDSTPTDTDSFVERFAETWPGAPIVPSKLVPIIDHPTSTASQSTTSSSTHTSRQDELARHVVQRLPDLTYMLR